MYDVTMLIVKANQGTEWAKELQKLWFNDLIRLVALNDFHYQMDDLKGDCFNPKVNNDISPIQLAIEEQAFEDRVNRLGVNGLVGEIRGSNGWEHVDSCWGFVGEDFINSGYDADISQTTINAVKKML